MGTSRQPGSTERDSPASSQGERASELLQLLAPERRQRIVTILKEQRSTIDRHVLAQTVATKESDAYAPGDAVIQRIEIDLHHNHLPALDDAGVVRYDPERETVQLGDTNRVKRALAAVERERDYSSGL